GHATWDVRGLDQRVITSPLQNTSDDLIPLHAWLIEAGTNDVAAKPLFDGFCGRVVAAGVPIARGFLSIAGLHPLRRAYSLNWNDGRIAEATDFGHATMATAMWQTSRRSPATHRDDLGRAPGGEEAGDENVAAGPGLGGLCRPIVARLP